MTGSPGFPIQGPYVATQVTPTSPARGLLARGLGAISRILEDRSRGSEVGTAKRIDDTLAAGPAPLWEGIPQRIPRIFHPNVGTYYGGLSQYATLEQWADGVRLPPPAIPRRARHKGNQIATTGGNQRIPAAMLPAGLNG
jgi:hypothetical protein